MSNTAQSACNVATTNDDECFCSTTFDFSTIPLHAFSNSPSGCCWLQNCGVCGHKFRGRNWGSKGVPHSPSPDANELSFQEKSSFSLLMNRSKIHSISAMPSYNPKSHELLRWEDYQLRGGDTYKLQKCPSCGHKLKGSGVVAYSPTLDPDSLSNGLNYSLIDSTSIMPVYSGKSHELLRWEDYQLMQGIK